MAKKQLMLAVIVAREWRQRPGCNSLRMPVGLAAGHESTVLNRCEFCS